MKSQMNKFYCIFSIYFINLELFYNQVIKHFKNKKISEYEK